MMTYEFAFSFMIQSTSKHSIFSSFRIQQINNVYGIVHLDSDNVSDECTIIIGTLLSAVVLTFIFVCAFFFYCNLF